MLVMFVNLSINLYCVFFVLFLAKLMVIAINLQHFCIWIKVNHIASENQKQLLRCITLWILAQALISLQSLLITGLTFVVVKYKKQ